MFLREGTGSTVLTRYLLNLPYRLPCNTLSHDPFFLFRIYVFMLKKYIGLYFVYNLSKKLNTNAQTYLSTENHKTTNISQYESVWMWEFLSRNKAAKIKMCFLRAGVAHWWSAERTSFTI